MSKGLLRLTYLLLITLYISFFLPKTTSAAANCSFIFNPNPPNQNMDTLSVTITSNDLSDGTYRVQYSTPDSGPNTFTVRPNEASISSQTSFVLKQNNGWKAGPYTLYFIQADNHDSDYKKAAKCRHTFTIDEIPVSSSTCAASIETKPIDPDTEVVLKLTGIAAGDYEIFVDDKFANRFKVSGDTTMPVCKGDPSKPRENCRFSVDRYMVSVKKDGRLQCNAVGFEVKPRGSGGGGPIGISDDANPKVCKKDDTGCTLGGGLVLPDCGVSGGNKDPRGPAISTAIGCIHTNPAEFAKDLLKFIIGIGGGLAFLMMLLGVFQMLTSQGNPETLNAGRERLTSAVVGLLFIIFAVLLLQIIGAGILDIPGFKP